MGVKVTDKVQLPAADTLVPQLFDSAKSPVAVIDEIASGELPMLRSRTVCAGLVEPTACEGYCREYGLEGDGWCRVRSDLHHKGIGAASPA